VIPPEELRHLTEGPRDGEVPGGTGLVEVLVRTSGDAGDLLRRCCDVLRVVVSASAPGDWPSEATWSARLPRWFVQAAAAEESEEQAAQWLAWWRGLDQEARARAARERPWSLADWLHWLQPDERQWYWWNGVAEGAHEARVFVEVSGWPAALGSLEWLLRAAGAESVNISESLVT
jgi:hypothetical protein